MLVSTAVSLLLAATQPASSAPPPGTSSEDRAVLYFHQGMKDYKEGRFREAIGEFLKADHLKPGAALMYNVGQSYEKLGDSTNAIRYYRAYLERDPAASDRRAVEATIRNLEARQRGEAALVRRRRPRPSRNPIGPIRRSSEAFVISLGIGGGCSPSGWPRARWRRSTRGRCQGSRARFRCRRRPA